MTSPSVESSANLDAAGTDSAAMGAANGAALAVEQCLDELAQLAQSEPVERDFYTAFLDRAVRLLAAEGGAAWQKSPGASARLVSQVRLPRPLVDLAQPAIEAAGTWTVAEPVILPPWARASARYPCDHPHPWPVVLCALTADADARIVLELALDRDAGPDVQSGAARLVGVMAEIAGDYQRRRELARLRQRDAHFAQFKQLVTGLHARLDPRQTAYAIANDGRQWIGCDRVSVLRLKADRAATLAVSAVDHVDRATAQVTALERLAAAVAKSGEPLAWHDMSQNELPPQLMGVLHDYLDLGHARQLVAVPLGTSALLIAESFAAQVPQELLNARTHELAQISGSALENALTHHALPLVPLQQRIAAALSALSRRPAASLMAVGAVVLGVVLLAVVPADFTVQAEGELQPQIRRNLFAPSDGVVEEVLVQHGESVRKGDVLLRLRNAALDLDQSRLSGELQMAQARLSAVRSARSRPPESDQAPDENQLASEEQQLQQQIAGIESQLAVLAQLRSELTVTSPLSGTVLTWNTHELLADRPVQQGQVLLTVADTTGPWTVELQVPDADAGHVLAGQGDDAATLPVSFLLASDPAVTHHGQLKRLAQVTDTSAGFSGARATIAIDGPLPVAARAGGRVSARIHCGRQAIGYVWLHDLIDFARTTFWF